MACLAIASCSDSSTAPQQSASAGSTGDGGLAGSAGAGTGAGGRDTSLAGAGGIAGGAAAGRSAAGAGGTTTTSPPVMEPPDLDPMAGNAGFVPPSCGAPVARIAGHLCGPSDAPCREIAEHTFDLLGSEPDVSLAFADGEVHILQQRATPLLFVPATDTFRATTEQIQGPTMKGNGAPLGSLAFDSAGAKVALLYGSRPGTTELWRRGSSGWAFDSRTQADSVARGRFLASAECLHAGLMLNNSSNPGQVSHPVYAVHDGSRWQEFVLGPANRDYPTFPALALDAAGTAHLAYWKDITRPGLYYAIPGRVLERVGATGPDTAPGVQHLPESPLLAVVEDAGETVVYIAHTSIELNRDERAITLATRRGDVWTEREIMRWQQSTAPACPMVEGQSCTFTVESVQQRALFASTSGDLRLFLERKTHVQTATYTCTTTTPLDCFIPPGNCQPVRMCGFNASPPAEPKDEQLIGWPEGDGFEFTPYDGPVPFAVSPDGHFWAPRVPSGSEPLTLVEHGP